MRPLVLILFLAFSLVFGLMYKPENEKPLWWKIFAILFVVVAAFLSFLPPLGGNYNDVIISSEYTKNKIPLNFKYLENINDSLIYFTKPEHLFSKKSDKKYILKLNLEKSDIDIIKKSNQVICLAYYDTTSKILVAEKLLSINPILVFPYVPALDERIRNLNYHVPMSWIGTIAFLFSMIYSIKYLRNKNILNDIKAESSAFIGLIFCILATTTGMVWAKFNWGAWWNNDPRQITILVLLIIYFAYFLLRNSIEQDDKKYKLSAFYSILAFSTVPMLIFIIPRQFVSLHPGSKEDGTSGPVIDTSSGMLDSELALSYYISLASLLIIFFWINSLNIRFKKLKLEIEND